MNDNEYIIVDSFSTEVYEDDYEHGEGAMVNGWSFKIEGKFKSVKEALDAVLDQNYFDKDLTWSMNDGIFSTAVTVDDDNCQAHEHELAAWKKGEMRLYACYLSVHLVVRTDARELTEDETEGYGE